MNHPHPLPTSRHYPDLNHARDLERLGDEITELAAHIHAATFQLLELIRVFDEEQGWGGYRREFVCPLAQLEMRHEHRRGT